MRRMSGFPSNIERKASTARRCSASLCDTASVRPISTVRRSTSTAARSASATSPRSTASLTNAEKKLNRSAAGRVADCLDEHDWVRLSLDSGTNDTFVRMHKPVDKTISLESICEWVPKVKAVNPRFKYGFSFIIVWKGAEREHDVKIVENIHEIVTAAKLARDYGFDYISLKPFLVRSSTGSEVMDPEKAEAELQGVVQRIRGAIDEAKQYGSDTFKVLESTNLKMLEQGNWRDFTNQPQTCHMQAFRQVLTPTGLYNCPAYRGVDRARIDAKDAYKDDAGVGATNQKLAVILDGFDASKECREVTCLYNEVNWWLEGLVKGDMLLDDLVGTERADYFL